MGVGWYHCGELPRQVHRAGWLDLRAVGKSRSTSGCSRLSSDAASKEGHERATRCTACLKLTYKTAWFMAHRIREAMRNDKASPIGGSGKIVEADETYFGPQKNSPSPCAQMALRTSAASAVAPPANAPSFRLPRLYGAPSERMDLGRSCGTEIGFVGLHDLT